MTDFQSAAINNTEQGWTTRGKPEGRAGGTYQNHLRWRDYFADMRVTVALRLQPAEQAPTLDDLANALQEPARPLFIGRKPCLPSAPLFGCFHDGDTALAALLSVPLSEDRVSPDRVGLLWPDGEGNGEAELNYSLMLTDQRNWISGLHGGGRLVHEGTATPDRFGGTPASETPATAEEEGQQ
jgi:CRISPR system Cascade subunit CasD